MFLFRIDEMGLSDESRVFVYVGVLWYLHKSIHLSGLKHTERPNKLVATLSSDIK